MALSSSFQGIQVDHTVERERERALAAERREESQARRQQRAQDRGMSVDEFSAKTKDEIAILQQKLSAINNASDVYYIILILSAVFKSAMTIMTIIPVIGIVFSIVTSLFLMILSVVILFVAKASEPVKVHNRFYVRLLILLKLHLFDTLLPLLSFFFPMALASTIGIYFLVKRDRRREKRRIEKKLVKLGAMLEA